MTTKDCVAVIDGVQKDHKPRLLAAKTVKERAYWEGFLSALTMAAMTIETKMKERK